MNINEINDRIKEHKAAISKSKSYKLIADREKAIARLLKQKRKLTT